VVVGSLGSGNNISTWRHADPQADLSGEQALEVANSVLTGHSSGRVPTHRILLIVLLGALSRCSLSSCARCSSLSAVLAITLYADCPSFCSCGFVNWLPRLPLSAPCHDSLCMITYRFRFEAERQAPHSFLFSKIVSPQVRPRTAQSRKILPGRAAAPGHHLLWNGFSA